MKTNLRKILILNVLCGTLALCGCVSLIPDPGPRPVRVVLEPDLGEIQQVKLKTTRSLAIAKLTASDDLESSRLRILREENGVTTSDHLAGYEYSNRLPKLVESTLLQAHERMGVFNSVGFQVDQFKRDYILEGNIRAFDVIYSSLKDRIEISLNLKWLRSKGRQSVHQQTFSAEVDLTDRSLPSIITALEQAYLKILKNIVATSEEIALAGK